MKRNAFTLVELLVVIAIIGILVALLLPAVNAARAAARRTQCKNTIRQLALACNTYAEANKALPHGGNRRNQLSWIAYILPYIEEKSIFDQMLTNNCFKDGEAGTAGTNNAGRDASGDTSIVHNPAYFSANYPIKTLYCPDTDNKFCLKSGHYLLDYTTTGTKQYTSHYQGVAGAKVATPPTDTTNINPYTGKIYSYVSNNRDGFATNGLLGITGTWGATQISPVKFKSIPDGISHTFMIGEACNDLTMMPPPDPNPKTPRYDMWVRGIFSGTNNAVSNNLTLMCKNMEFSINLPIPTGGDNSFPFTSNHTGGAHFALGDSSVVFVSEDTDLILLRALASRNGGEPPTLP